MNQDACHSSMTILLGYNYYKIFVKWTILHCLTDPSSQYNTLLEDIQTEGFCSPEHNKLQTGKTDTDNALTPANYTQTMAIGYLNIDHASSSRQKFIIIAKGSKKGKKSRKRK